MRDGTGGPAESAPPGEIVHPGAHHDEHRSPTSRADSVLDEPESSCTRRDVPMMTASIAQKRIQAPPRSEPASMPAAPPVRERNFLTGGHATMSEVAAATTLQTFQRGQSTRRAVRMLHNQAVDLAAEAKLAEMRRPGRRFQRAASSNDPGRSTALSRRAMSLLRSHRDTIDHALVWLMTSPVSYREARSRVRIALAAYANSSAARKGAAVTEQLGGIDASAERVELLSSTSPSLARSQPSCCFRRTARRPCLVIGCVWFFACVCAILVAAFGELTPTVQSSLFLDTSHSAVRRNELIEQLRFSNHAHARLLPPQSSSRRRAHPAGRAHQGGVAIRSTSEQELRANGTLLNARRKLSQQCPHLWESDGPLLGGPEAVEAGFFVFEFVYASHDSGPLIDSAKVKRNHPESPAGQDCPVPYT